MKNKSGHPSGRDDKEARESGRMFDEILAPFRDAVERSGISDEELETLLVKPGGKFLFRTARGSEQAL
jgi:hypothetical protein